MLSLFGCGKQKYDLKLPSGFESKKTSYAAGEEVKVTYPFVATDTDYSFYSDADGMKQGYTDSEGAFTEAEKSTSTRVFSSKTATLLQQMMEKVLSEDGTGGAGKPQFGIAGAKTGTAETGWASAENEKYAVVHSWYAGYYAPQENTQYVIVVFAENAENTGAKTALVFKEIADALYMVKTEE